MNVGVFVLASLAGVAFIWVFKWNDREYVPGAAAHLTVLVFAALAAVLATQSW